MVYDKTYWTAKKQKKAPLEYAGGKMGESAGDLIGGILGGAAGIVGGPTGVLVGAEIGTKIGHGVGGLIGAGLGFIGGKITGTGDYVMSKYPVSNNNLVNVGEVPQFVNNGMGTVICHREYIGDVITSSNAGGFFNQNLAINPGLTASFPWLAVVAQNFEEYVVHGMVYEFKSTSADSLNSTNTALGTVIMATQYNSVNGLFTNKQQMENYEFAQSAKPSISQIHAVECARKRTPVTEMFVRSGPVPAGQDPRWSDLGIFQIATVGFPAASVNIGELWCSYCIELLKPKIPQNVGGPQIGGQTQAFHYRASNGAGTGFSFANTSNVNTGSLSLISNTGTVITIGGVSPGNRYAIVAYFTPVTATTIVTNLQFGTLNTVNLSLENQDTNSSLVTPTGAPVEIFSTWVQMLPTATTLGLNLTVGGVWGVSTVTNYDIFIYEIDGSITS